MKKINKQHSSKPQHNNLQQYFKWEYQKDNLFAGSTQKQNFL